MGYHKLGTNDIAAILPLKDGAKVRIYFIYKQKLQIILISLPFLFTDYHHLGSRLPQTPYPCALLTAA